MKVVPCRETSNNNVKMLIIKFKDYKNKLLLFDVL
jgi:hypothetical protein